MQHCWGSFYFYCQKHFYDNLSASHSSLVMPASCAFCNCSHGWGITTALFSPFVNTFPNYFAGLAFALKESVSLLCTPFVCRLLCHQRSRLLASLLLLAVIPLQVAMCLAHIVTNCISVSMARSAVYSFYIYHSRVLNVASLVFSLLEVHWCWVLAGSMIKSAIALSP